MYAPLLSLCNAQIFTKITPFIVVIRASSARLKIRSKNRKNKFVFYNDKFGLFLNSFY